MELNQLRTEAGMTRVKTGKRSAPPIPENPEWYVFRSGKSEGPYTKLQLLEIQKITDRTKVRRGETEWQRASEIPELAAYLTEK
jgi:GYF domain 2